MINSVEAVDAHALFNVSAGGLQLQDHTYEGIKKLIGRDLTLNERIYMRNPIKYAINLAISSDMANQAPEQPNKPTLAQRIQHSAPEEPSSKPTLAERMGMGSKQTGDQTLCSTWGVLE